MTENVVNYIKTRRLKGPVCVPTEIYSKMTMYRKLMGHLSSVYCVCFDQTGNYIFTGADDYLIKIWSARDGRLLKTLRGHEGQIIDLSVNYENRLLASAGMDRIIRIWDLKTSKLLHCLNAHSATVTSIKFAPFNRHADDRYLISTSNDGSIVFWAYKHDTFEFKKLRKVQERNRPGGQIACSSFSTGGTFLACGSSDNFLHIYGFGTHCGPYWIKELEHHRDKVDSVQFCNAGYRFTSGSKDGTAVIWTFKDGDWRAKQLDMSTQLHQSASTQPSANSQSKPAVLIVQWSRDDRFVLTSTVDYSIKVWDSFKGDLVHVLKEHRHDVYLIESHPTDARIMVSASHDGTMIIWDIEKGKILKKFFNPADTSAPYNTNNSASIYDLKFSPDGNMIAATDSYGYLSIYGYGDNTGYRAVPEQMFFHTDYRALIRDVDNFVMDEQTHLAPHLMPKPKLVDMNGNPYPEDLQKLVPEGKIVIPPLSHAQIRMIAETIEKHGRMEEIQFRDDDEATIIDSDSSTEIDESTASANQTTARQIRWNLRPKRRRHPGRPVRWCSSRLRDRARLKRRKI